MFMLGVEKKRILLHGLENTFSNHFRWTQFVNDHIVFLIIFYTASQPFGELYIEGVGISSTIVSTIK